MAGAGRNELLQLRDDLENTARSHDPGTSPRVVGSESGSGTGLLSDAEPTVHKEKQACSTLLGEASQPTW